MSWQVLGKVDFLKRLMEVSLPGHGRESPGSQALEAERIQGPSQGPQQVREEMAVSISGLRGWGARICP